MPASRSVVSVLLRALGDSSLHPSRPALRAAARPEPGQTVCTQTRVDRIRSIGGRSHNDALVGCIVWSTTASSSAESASKSTSS
jgi:hypothetical protein